MATFYTRPEIAQQTVVQAPDPLEAQSKYLAVRNQQQQGQMQGLQLQQTQQEMADQQKVRDAFQQAGGDWDKTFEIAAKSGISPSTLSKLDAARLDHKQKLAAATKEEREAYVKKSEIAAAAARSFMELRQHDPVQAQATYTQLKPQLEQQLGVKLPDQIPSDSELQFQASLSEKTLKDMREAETHAAELPGKKAASKIQEAEADAITNTGGVPAKMEDSKYRFILQKVKAGQPISQGDYDFAVGYEASNRKTSTTSDELGMASTTTSGPAGLAGMKPKIIGQSAPAPKATVVKPRAAQQSTAPAQESGELETGESFLKKLNPATAGIVKGIGDYRQNPATVSRLMVKHPGLLGLVQQYNPTYDDTNYAAKTQFMRNVTSGSLGKEINAINTAMGHVGVLGEAIDALNNSDVRVINSMANRLGLEVGSDKMTTFKTIVHRVGPELAAAYIQGGGTAGERGADEKDFDPSMSPEQLKANVAVTARLLRSKIGSLENQYANTVGRKDFAQRFITKEAQKTLDKWNPQQGSGTVRLRAPNGDEQDVPADQVEHYKKLGATVVHD